MDGAFVFELDLGPDFNGPTGQHAGVSQGALGSSASARLYLDHVLVLAVDSADPAKARARAPAGDEGGVGGVAGHASSAVPLARGVLYRLRVEFTARRGGVSGSGSGARCRLLWRSGMTPLQVVPSFFLYPAAEHIDGSPMPLKVFDT
jgi:hypothetical protein